MNTQSNLTQQSTRETQLAAPVVISATRRMYWSVQCELWEYRSIYIAPLAVAMVVVFAFSALISNVPVALYITASSVNFCSSFRA